MEIVLKDNNLGVYESGQVVSGAFTVPATERVKAEDVTIKLVGMIEIEGVPEANYGAYGLPPQVLLLETNKCLEQIHEMTEHDVWKTNDGVQEIGFEFTLPHCGIPSSYETTDASIRYHIEAVVKGEDRRVERQIQVVAPVRHSLNIPITSIIEKDFCALSVVFGRIKLQASLLRKGHYPGEALLLYCDLQNDSSAEVTPRACLYQKKKLMFQERDKASQSVLTYPVVGQKVDKHLDAREILVIQLPTDIPLTFKDELFAVKYFIHVTLDIPHAFDIHVNLPIVVTTKSAIDEQMRRTEDINYEIITSTEC